MTKRQAILAGIAGTIGLMLSRAKTEPLAPSAGTMSVWQQGPQSVSINLDMFAKFTFHLGDDQVTVTGKEIFEALKAAR